ncbi:MAG: DUF6154 family protein [Vulcanibacillus sp.]
MSFVDEIYDMYKSHLSRNEEDAIALVLNLLQDHKREELLSKINEMDDYEIYQMLSIYLIEALKVRIAKGEIDEIEGKWSRIEHRFH